jgi:hypothetical protein
MTEFRTKVLDKLTSNFDKNDINEAEVLTNKLFDEEISGGTLAVEELLLNEIKNIIETSGINIDDFEEQLEDY